MAIDHGVRRSAMPTSSRASTIAERHPEVHRQRDTRRGVDRGERCRARRPARRARPSGPAGRAGDVPGSPREPRRPSAGSRRPRPDGPRAGRCGRVLGSVCSRPTVALWSGRTGCAGGGEPRCARRPKIATSMITTTITGKNWPGAHQLNATAHSTSPADDRDQPDRDAAPAQLADEPIDRRVGRCLAPGSPPRQQVGEHAGAAEERRGREQHPEQHRVDAEVLAEAARDAGADPVGTAAAQQPLRLPAPVPAAAAGRDGSAELVSRGRHGSKSAAPERARRIGWPLNRTLNSRLRGSPDARTGTGAGDHGPRDRRPPTAPRRLYRRPDRGLVGGVAAGIAEHIGVRPRLVRLAVRGARRRRRPRCGALRRVLDRAADRRPAPVAAAFPAWLEYVARGGGRGLGGDRSSRTAAPVGGLFVPDPARLPGRCADLAAGRPTSTAAGWRRLSRTRSWPRGTTAAGRLRLVAGAALVVGGAVLVLAHVELHRDPRRAAAAMVVTVVGLALLTGPWWMRHGRRSSAPSAANASARRSAPTSPRTCTTRCCRRWR